MLLLYCKGEPLSLIAVHQQFAEPCHQSILRAPTTDFHVTSVSCEPAALSRPAADGGAKACRQSASHSLAAREPGITVRRLQVAPAHERRAAAGDSSSQTSALRASRLRRLTSLTTVDRQKGDIRLSGCLIGPLAFLPVG